MDIKQLKANLINAANQFKDAMNAYGRIGFSVDANVQYMESLGVDGTTIIHHNISIEITEGLRL